MRSSWLLETVTSIRPSSGRSPSPTVYEVCARTVAAAREAAGVEHHAEALRRQAVTVGDGERALPGGRQPR